MRLTVKLSFLGRNFTISSTWTKLETPARTLVEFWRWRDAHFLWTSSTQSGTLCMKSSVDTGFLFDYFDSTQRWCVFSPVPDYVKATVETVIKLHEADEDGDVLAFLTGQVTGLFDSAIILWSPFHRKFLRRYSFLIWWCSYFSNRMKWRKWCHFCRSRPGLCQDTAWRNTSEFCPCTLVCLTLTRWRSLTGSPPLFAR